MKFLDIAKESYLTELLEYTKRKPSMPFRIYDKDEMMGFKSNNRAKV